MTYNQINSALKNLLESHVMIKEVKNLPPQEWLFRDSQPTFPICCFDVVNGSYNKGNMQVWGVQFFFLDKSGPEAKFEPDVISDQWQIAEDIIEKIRTNGIVGAFIDDSVSIEPVSDKFEDYLAGVTFTVNIETIRSVNSCNVL